MQWIFPVVFLLCASSPLFAESAAESVAEPVTLAAEDDYFPFSAEIEGELVGFVPALATAAFAEVGMDVKYRVSPYSRVLVLVEEGKVAGGFTGAIDDSNRSEFYWHSTPVGSVRLSIWARTGTEEGTLTANDLHGKNVSVTRGFFNTDEVDHNPRINKIMAPSDASSLRMLALGRSDYSLVTDAIGQTIVDKWADLKGKVEIVGTIAEVDLYLFFSKNHPDGKEAAELFQAGLEAIMANGIYDQLAKRWLPQSTGG